MFGSHFNSNTILENPNFSAFLSNIFSWVPDKHWLFFFAWPQEESTVAESMK